MSGGGANPTGGQYPAPVVSGLFGQANQQFQPSPYPNTPDAASNAFGQIGSGFNQGYNEFGGWTPQTQAGNAQNAFNVGGQAFDNAQQAITQGQAPLGLGSNFNQYANALQQQSFPAISQNLTSANTIENQLAFPDMVATMQQGFDPQQKLFNQLFNQQQQQGLASQAAAGVANTPYGAGLSQQGNQNFDIAWQNQQLARQGQAAQNASQLAGLASPYYQNAQQAAGLPSYAANIGQGLYGEASNMLGQGSNFLGQGGNLLGVGGSLGTGAGNYQNNVNQQQIQDYLAYLSGSSGNAANLMNSTIGSLNAGTGLYGAQTGANAQQQQLLNSGLGGLGSGLGLAGGLGLANLFSGAGAAGGLGGTFGALAPAAFAL